MKLLLGTHPRSVQLMSNLFKLYFIIDLTCWYLYCQHENLGSNTMQYVGVVKLYLVTRFLPIAAHFWLAQNWQKQHPCSIGRLICISAKSEARPQKPFSTNCGTFLIDPKLAETAPLLYRATDVPFLPKMEQEPKLVETIFYQLWHISDWSKIGRNSTPAL